MWRAYQLEEALRAILAGTLDVNDASELPDRWCDYGWSNTGPDPTDFAGGAAQRDLVRDYRLV